MEELMEAVKEIDVDTGTTENEPGPIEPAF
jgi:hypothetical protein